jgi:hypothetical protein
MDRESKTYKAAYDKAMRYFAEDRDEKYIVLQLAEQGVDEEIIDEVVKEIRKMNKQTFAEFIGELLSGIVSVTRSTLHG